MVLLVGLIPACVTALLYWLILRNETQGNFSPGERATLGFVLGFTVISFPFILSAPFKLEDGLVCLNFALSGGVASSVCALCISEAFYIKLFPQLRTVLPGGAERRCWSGTRKIATGIVIIFDISFRFLFWPHLSATPPLNGL